MRIHGVNLSVGYEFDPEWFACGQSPLCEEVDKLVRSGRRGRGRGRQLRLRHACATSWTRRTQFGLGMTINDPGNAERAITVGSTHRDAPHTYGVSYFSSKGPTGDGRRKPDLVAPGRADHLVRGRAAARRGAGRPARPRHRRLRRGQRHQHGRAARVRRDRRPAVGAARVHRTARGGQARSSSTPRRSLGRGAEFEGAGLLDLMRRTAVGLSESERTDGTRDRRTAVLAADLRRRGRPGRRRSATRSSPRCAPGR